jgi:hypothetical protein
VRRKGKFRWSAVAGFITTALGVVTGPAVLGTFDRTTAAAIVIAGAVWQAATGRVVRDAHERIS